MSNNKILLFSGCLLCCVLINGCGKAETQITETPQIKQENIIETTNVSQNSLSLLSEENQSDPAFQNLDFTNVKDINTVTEDELISMPIDEIKKMIAVNTEDFRNTYLIDETKELTDEDWEKIRFIFYYQLFGYDGLEYYFSTGTDEEFIEKAQLALDREVIIENYQLTEEEANYLLPTSEYIESLSVEEFREWLKHASVYYADEEFDYSNLNYDNLTDDIILETKTNYLTLLKEQELEKEKIKQELEEIENRSFYQE